MGNYLYELLYFNLLIVVRKYILYHLCTKYLTLYGNKLLNKVSYNSNVRDFTSQVKIAFRLLNNV